jgi:hypothetical protein
MVIDAQAHEALLPVGDQVVSAPLVLGVQAEFFSDLKGAEVIVPANGFAGIQAVVLRKRRLVPECNRAHIKMKKYG